MLIEHGVHDVNKSLIAGKEAMPTSKEITFEPALAHVFAQDFHYAAIWREVFVSIKQLLHEYFRGGFINCVKSIGGGLVGSKYAKIRGIQVCFHHIAKKLSKYPRRFRLNCSGFGNVHGVRAKIRHRQIAKESSAIRMWVSSHSALAFWREIFQFLQQISLRIKKLFGFIAVQPVFQDFQMLGITSEIADRHLVCTPRAFDRFAIHNFGSGPALRRPQDDHRPFGHADSLLRASSPLNRLNFVYDVVEGVRHLLMDFFWLASLDEKRLVAVPSVEFHQIFVAHPPRHGWICDLVAIEVKNR